MAEYFPLLDRAVSGLTEPTAEARRSIYERARTALIGQLSRMDPPVPEEDIARESAALDEAIARVEARFAAAHPAGPAPESPPVVVPPPPAPEAPSVVVPPAPPRPGPIVSPLVGPPPLPTGTAPPVAPPARERPVIGPRPTPAPERPAQGAGRLPPRPAPGPATRGTRPVMALRPGAGPTPGEERVPPDRQDEAGLPPAGRLPTEAPAAAGSEGAGFAAALDAAADRAAAPAEEASAAATPARSRDAGQRPPAPRPREARRLGWPILAGLAAAVLVMIGIGVAAYRLRDRPEQVVAAHAAASQAPEAEAPGKTVDRASPASTDAAGDASASEPVSGAAVPAPVGQNGTDGAPAPSGPAIAVAQRAALLVDAPDEPQRVKTYVGTVVWHLDSVSPGQGQPLATAVKADVDIPDAKLKVTMLMQRNPEPQLPASHTIEFHFLPQGGNSLGSVKQVNVPEMRKDDDAPTGDPLAGVPVAITDNYFLVGLSRGAAESQNMRLIAERNWFDMSLLFVSGKLGKLTFEKGAAGQRTFDDAIAAWK